MNKQKFIDKFMAAFVLLAMFKIIGIVAQLFHESFWSVIGTLIIFLIVAFIIFMVIVALKAVSYTHLTLPTKRIV